jgi:alpha-1,2-glucosyltransferase
MLTPTIFFYTVLFYTDVAGLAFLLMAHYYTGWSGPRAFLAGLVALAIRQTNIVWVVYSALAHYLNSKSQSLETSPRLLSAAVGFCWADRKIILRRYGWQVALVVIFLAAVRRNGGVALGDQANHVPQLHLAQLCYLLLFLSATVPTSWSCALSILKLTLARLLTHRNALATFSLLCSLLTLAVDRSTFWHPFIYSDNRHYTFYLYKDIFKAHYIKFVPVYALCLVAAFRMVVASRVGVLRFVLWAGAAALVLVPAGLV